MAQPDLIAIWNYAHRDGGDVVISQYDFNMRYNGMVAIYNAGYAAGKKAAQQELISTTQKKADGTK